MVNCNPEVVYDVKHRYARRPSTGAGLRSMKGPKPSSSSNEYDVPEGTESLKYLGLKDEEMDIRKIWEDIRLLGSSDMSWKQRKKLEDQKVVNLGGKTPKKQKMALSVSQPRMKSQKKKEQKKLAEDLILGRFVKRPSTEKNTKKRKPEDIALKTSEGLFRGGVLDVKHLLNPRKPKNSEGMANKEQNKSKKKGKGKGKGRKNGKQRRR